MYFVLYFYLKENPFNPELEQHLKYD